MKFPNDLRLDDQSAIKLMSPDQGVKSFARSSKPVKMKGEFKQPGHWPLNTTGAGSSLLSGKSNSYIFTIPQTSG